MASSSSSSHPPPTASSSDLFSAPPPFAQPYDPLSPNPLLTWGELEAAEHFRLMSRGTVEDMRLLGCQIIQSGVRMLKMSQASLYTAQILFNQFYARESFLDFPLLVLRDVVMASVFVAGKVEESIRRARDIVNVFHHLYSLIRDLPPHPIDYVGDTYYIWRDRLCTMESLLLRELGFHVQPASPVGLLLSYMKILEITEHLDVAQVALNYLNDALKTSAYVLYQPHVLAVSSISLALDHLSLADELLPSPRDLIAPWYSLFDVNETELVECKKVIMTVYNRELDVLLPLTKEELTIFSGSIKESAVIEEVNEKKGKDGTAETRSERSEGSKRPERLDRSDSRPSTTHSRSHSPHSHSSLTHISHSSRDYDSRDSRHSKDDYSKERRGSRDRYRDDYRDTDRDRDREYRRYN